MPDTRGDAALAEVRAWVSENGLTLHPAKTHVGGRVEDARFQHVSKTRASSTTGSRDKGSTPARVPGQGPSATGSKPAGASWRSTPAA